MKTNQQQENLCLYDGKSLDGKRADAIFCSDECRNMYHNSIAEKKRLEVNNLITSQQEQITILKNENEKEKKINAEKELEISQLKQQLQLSEKEIITIKDKHFRAVTKLNKIYFEKLRNRMKSKKKDINNSQNILNFLVGKSAEK